MGCDHDIVALPRDHPKAAECRKCLQQFTMQEAQAVARDVYWRREMQQIAHFISATCQGQKCSMCETPVPATHKVGEEIAHDDPHQVRHNLTAYVCCWHFGQIMHTTCKRKG